MRRRRSHGLAFQTMEPLAPMQMAPGRGPRRQCARATPSWAPPDRIAPARPQQCARPHSAPRSHSNGPNWWLPRAAAAARRPSKFSPRRLAGPAAGGRTWPGAWPGRRAHEPTSGAPDWLARLGAPASAGVTRARAAPTWRRRPDGQRPNVASEPAGGRLGAPGARREPLTRALAGGAMSQRAAVSQRAAGDTNELAGSASGRPLAESRPASGSTGY